MSKRNHLKERLNEKLEAVTFKTLIVGVDIAKHNQWARFVDCRGIEHSVCDGLQARTFDPGVDGRCAQGPRS